MRKPSPRIALLCAVFVALLFPAVALANGLISNGDFELNSHEPWVEVSLPADYADYPIIQDDASFPTLGGGGDPIKITAHSGSKAAWFGLPIDFPEEETFTSSLSQQINVDNPSESVYALVFYHWIDSTEADGVSDVGRVWLDGSLVLEIHFTSNVNSTFGWVKVRVALPNPLTTDQVLKFESQQDGILPTNWFIDDVSIIDVTHQLFIPAALR